MTLGFREVHYITSLNPKDAYIMKVRTILSNKIVIPNTLLVNHMDLYIDSLLLQFFFSSFMFFICWFHSNFDMELSHCSIHFSLNQMHVD